jgi:transcriptional repressor NrdR|tara:strand:- start:2146 stop:2601 length:456 start_codon:yes stop_codon:yes gene_type:complete
MKCPYCSSTEHRVTDKRETPNDMVTKRRRECSKCSKRFTTYEQVEDLELFIIKKDGSRDPFDSNKIRRGIIRACEKRPISIEKINDLMHEIEAELRKQDSNEIESTLVGQIAMEKLLHLDKVAYIRFASVYRDFRHLRSFEKEIQAVAKVK